GRLPRRPGLAGGVPPARAPRARLLPRRDSREPRQGTRARGGRPGRRPLHRPRGLPALARSGLLRDVEAGDERRRRRSERRLQGVRPRDVRQRVDGRQLPAVGALVYRGVRDRAHVLRAELAGRPALQLVRRRGERVRGDHRRLLRGRAARALLRERRAHLPDLTQPKTFAGRPRTPTSAANTAPAWVSWRSTGPRSSPADVITSTSRSSPAKQQLVAWRAGTWTVATRSPVGVKRTTAP